MWPLYNEDTTKPLKGRYIFTTVKYLQEVKALGFVCFTLSREKEPELLGEFSK